MESPPTSATFLSLSSFREARVIEQMATRAEDLIERVQVQSVGVGQHAVNVEQPRLSLPDWLTRTFGPLEVGVRKSDEGHSQSRLNKAG